jgi:hypothetical protein
MAVSTAQICANAGILFADIFSADEIGLMEAQGFIFP